MGYVIEDGLLESGIEEILRWRVLDIGGFGGIPHIPEVEHNTVVALAVKEDEYAMPGPSNLP